MADDKNLFRYFILAVLLGFIGFIDSTYLTAVHYLDGAPGCGEHGGCDEVANSEYATFVGIPVALFGVLYYLAVIMLGVRWFDTRAPQIPKYILVIVAPAFVFSSALVYLMFFVIEAICWWCMVSAGSTTILLLATLFVVLSNRKS